MITCDDCLAFSVSNLRRLAIDNELIGCQYSLSDPSWSLGAAIWPVLGPYFDQASFICPAPVERRDFGTGALLYGCGKDKRLSESKAAVKIRYMQMILIILQAALPLPRQVKPVVPFARGTGCGRVRQQEQRSCPSKHRHL